MTRASRSNAETQTEGVGYQGSEISNRLDWKTTPPLILGREPRADRCLLHADVESMSGREALHDR